MADNEHRRTEGTRLTVSAGKEIDNAGKIGGPTPTKDPELLARRLAVYETVKARREAEMAAQPREKIEVTLPDGKVMEGTAWETSPFDIAMQIAQGLADKTVVAKVRYTSRVGQQLDVTDSSGMDEGVMDDFEVPVAKGELWDVKRPLEGSCHLELLKFDEPEAKMVFWHSSAHVLGECMECCFGAHLTVGPPIDPGFYYDCYMGDKAFNPDMIAEMKKDATRVTKEKQVFERIVLTKDEALEMFQDNPFKVSIIKNKIKDGSMTTAYRCGPLIDLCMGPHISHTGKIKAFELTKQSAAYWLGDAENDSLQRVYGISFPDKKMMKEHKQFVKLAEENDHRKRGAEQDLFFFHPWSPGSCFFLPHGTRIFNTLTDFIKSEYHNRGYSEVVTPNMYNVDLWKRSGHWDHYKDDMFSLREGDSAPELAAASTDNKDDTQEAGAQYALKPMNCPGHCLLFGHQSRSYRELPLRIADFGVLHRNELSGALSGLTRVRRFQQDDAHIFCRQNQIKEEVLGVLDFMQSVYGVFGMSYKLELSTRPKKAVGLDTPEGKGLWDMAEEQLALALDEFVGKGNWRVNPGDGAFYGPKIDIKVFDAMKRKHQCATVQLDFQLPIRFDLKYIGDGVGQVERPVMIHRAILGSVERMVGVLTEHYGGKWPFWLSPRQVMIVPIHEAVFEYANKVKALLHEQHIFVDVDLSSKTLNKKVLNAQKAHYTFVIVVGEQESLSNSVNIRTKRFGLVSNDTMLAYFRELVGDKTKTEDLEAVFDKYRPPAQEEAASKAAADAPAAPKEE